MNYNSVQEILNAGTTNMTIIRNNNKQDDGTDTITGVSWFTYNGSVASTIYASGNSFIGFGSSNEHLKVNRRDCALYSLYREEGTLYGYYKFLKIRWKGYSAYNNTGTSYAVEYDVILWDTGDISLHMVSIPTAQNNGTYSLVASSTYTYTVSTSNPDITFKKTNSGFTVTNGIIDLQISMRYLVRSDSNYYTITNDVLSEIQVAELTSDVFRNFGIEFIPSISLLNELSNPEILFWTEVDGWVLNDGLIVKGTPPLPYFVYYDAVDMFGYNGIEKLYCIASSDALFSVSIDDGQTWKYYDNGTWVTALTDLHGMFLNVTESITPTAWSEIITPSTTCKFRCVLTSVTSHVSKIYIKYN